MANPRSGRRWMHRILARLEALERHASQNETALDAEIYRLAWLTVDLSFRSRPDAAAEASRIVYGRARAPAWTLPFPTSAPPDLAPAEVDGRRAHHWVASILKYLEWRSGQPWRSMTEMRKDPMAANYMAAINLLHQVQNNDFPQGTPAKRPEPKPVVSERPLAVAAKTA